MKFTKAKHATRLRRVAPIVALAAFAATGGHAMAGTVADSSPILVFQDKSLSSFWHTATNATLAVPVEFPAGVSSATLTVTANRYSASYEVAQEGDFVLTLPAATSQENENVYLLTLDFGDGSPRTATLGLVQSFGANGEASTRVKLPEGSPTWGRVGQRAVIPIPHGITSFTVDGVATETGLDGDAGWFAMSLHGGQTAALALQDAEMDSFNALLSRLCDATHVVFR